MIALPGVLSRYIARHFSATLALILLAASLVIFLADYVEVLRRFGDAEGFTGLTGVGLAAMHVPILLDTALPFAFLFAALLSLIGLSRKLELVVARASGVSVWGFLKAPFVLAILIGAGATAILSPVAVNLKEQAEHIEATLSGRTGEGGHWFRQDGRDGPSIVYAGSVDEGGRVLFGVTAFLFDTAGQLREKIKAPRAEYGPNRWTFLDAVATSAEEGPRPVPRYDLPTELAAAELMRSFAEPGAISVWSLPAAIATAERTGLDPDRFRVAFHALISRPIFLLAMVMIAATVSLRLSRQGGTWRLILAGAAIGFLLYAFSEIASDLGANGIINPVLAAWLPPIVAMTFGATALLIQEDG